MYPIHFQVGCGRFPPCRQWDPINKVGWYGHCGEVGCWNRQQQGSSWFGRNSPCGGSSVPLLCMYPGKSLLCHVGIFGCHPPNQIDQWGEAPAAFEAGSLVLILLLFGVSFKDFVRRGVAIGTGVRVTNVDIKGGSLTIVPETMGRYITLSLSPRVLGVVSMGWEVGFALLAPACNPLP